MFGQSEFKKDVDRNAKNLPYDKQATSVLINNLENKMLQDLGWEDKVVWVKGVVKNLSVGAIDAKCGTKKNEIFYFRTVIKNVDGDVLWDTESFSPKVTEAFNQKSNDIQSYMKKLQTFKDSLYTAYNNKYDSILNNYKLTYEKTLNQYGKTGEKYRLKHSSIEKSLEYIKRDIKYWKEKYSNFILPIDMYESDFKTTKKAKVVYQEVTNLWRKESDKIKTESEKSILNSIQANILKLKNDLSIYKVEETKNDSIKALDQQIANRENELANKLEDLIENMKKSENKKEIKKCYKSSSDELKRFFNMYIKPYPSYQYTDDIKRLFLNDINRNNNRLKKLERLKYWEESYSFWNRCID